MGGKFLCSILIFLLPVVTGHVHNHQLCGNDTRVTRSCTTQILGKDHANLDSCKVEYIAPNSTVCMENFGPITSDVNIGGVSLKPYILPLVCEEKTRAYSVNYTVLNITFTNIKWKTMKFRFQKYKNVESHCRNIAISNDVTIDDQSVLYYDCYWSVTDGNYNGRTHILDFEATDDVKVHRGRYYFNIPSAQMLSPTITEKDWKPFVYIEIGSTDMKLHITPPPARLKVTAYRVLVKRRSSREGREGREGGEGADETHQNRTLRVLNGTDEVTFGYSLLKDAGAYYFVVTPLHDGCIHDEQTCQSVESPMININSDHIGTLHVCIVSIVTLILVPVTVYYIGLKLLRRYWCKEYATVGKEVPQPPKILVIYRSASRLHAECVASCVAYIRAEYGFDVMFDGDIPGTPHGDPYIWAEEAMRLATHVLYVVGPAEEAAQYNNIYDQPIITPYKDVDVVLLSLLKAARVARARKDVMNVYFEHSTGELPPETRHDRCYRLMRDWQGLVAHLSRFMPPKKQIMRTDKGRSFLDDLKRAKKLLADNRDDFNIKCDKTIPIEKKVLL